MTTILSDEEKEKQVIDLYFNQGKNTHEIAKLLRISLSSIGPIIKKEKQRRSAFYNVDNANDGNNNGKLEEQQQQHRIILSSSAEVEELSDKQKAAIAYKLYDQGRTPVQVVTTLFLTAHEAMMYYRYFWKLKRQHQLYEIYPEIEQSLPSCS